MLVVRKGSFLDCCHMFLVDSVAAAAIRQAYNVAGEPGALAELRKRFPGIVDDETARLCARTIANWKPFEPGRRARKCNVRLARRSESARQTADRERAATAHSESLPPGRP
jgi:hypothetical protein